MGGSPLAIWAQIAQTADKYTCTIHLCTYTCLRTYEHAVDRGRTSDDLKPSYHLGRLHIFYTSASYCMLFLGPLVEIMLFSDVWKAGRADWENRRSRLGEEEETLVGEESPALEERLHLVQVFQRE